MLGARSGRSDPTEESERQHEGGTPRRPVEPDHVASVGGLVIPCKIAFCTRSNAESRLPPAKRVALESGVAGSSGRSHDREGDDVDGDGTGQAH
jgi:hypothetical protein